jgi:sporulation protein YlmC with PRC-barrel domain
MSTVLAGSLSGKSIVGTDGTVFGTLHTVSASAESGALENLIVDPRDDNPDPAVGVGNDDAGRLLVPIDQVKTVKDQIVIHHEPV